MWLERPVLIGRGAGHDATSSSVISDIADSVALWPVLMSSIDLGFGMSTHTADQVSLALNATSDWVGRYYFRFHVKDKEGVLAQLSNIFAEHHISFATVNQKELPDASALIMVTTHETNEASVLEALFVVLSRKDLHGEEANFYSNFQSRNFF